MESESAHHQPKAPLAIRMRTTILHEDVARIAALHREIYSREYGFDATFETYVAEPLAEFADRRAANERIWIAEHDGEIVGCVAIVAASENTAQLRWFLVAPSARGHGLGARLLREAVEFSRQRGYSEIILWTVSALVTAAHLYKKAGFTLAEQRPGRCWGVDVVEERYEMALSAPAGA